MSETQTNAPSPDHPPVTVPAAVDLSITPDALSPRQLEVALGLARGLTTHEIGAEITLKTGTAISSKTVDSHRGNVLHRLGLRNAADVARWAIKHNLIAIGE